jgi:hypothetical protein
MPAIVQQLFSSRSLSDVSWGKVRSLTERRNTQVGMDDIPCIQRLLVVSIHTRYSKNCY